MTEKEHCPHCDVAYPDEDALACIACGARRIAPPAGRRSEYEQQATKTLEYLQLALTCARNAKSERTAARIRLAISSAKGAVRAAGYRAAREHERQVTP